MSTEMLSYDDTTITNLSPTSTESPMTTLATFLLDIDRSPSLQRKSYQREHLEHNKITFEIPNHRDLEHIDSMHNFNTLLKRIGNVVTSSDSTQFTDNNHQYNNILHNQYQEYHHQDHDQQEITNLLTNAEISKSVVLDLADLKGNNDGNFGLERFFAGADMHSIINYLWIGVVTSLIILSIVFIVFSCYFYRKFREWKKCNKDIRAHLNGNNNGSEIVCGHGGTGRTYLGQGHTAYYQMESPPCYTIATGLPSYDEALLHHYHHHHHQQHDNCANNFNNDQHHAIQQKQQKQNYFNYAFKYIHQQHQHSANLDEQQQQQQNSHNILHQVSEYDASTPAEYFIRNWKKTPEMAPSINSTETDDKMLQRKPPKYNVTKNIALLNSINTDVELAPTPKSLNDDKIENATKICIKDRKEIDVEGEQYESNLAAISTLTSSSTLSSSSSSTSSQLSTTAKNSAPESEIDDSLSCVIVA